MRQKLDLAAILTAPALGFGVLVLALFAFELRGHPHRGERLTCRRCARHRRRSRSGSSIFGTSWLAYLNGADRFRWVGGDAIIELHPTRRDTLEFDAESGPGMRSQPFRLHVVGSDGIEIVSAEIGSRTHVTVPLRGADGSASLLLRADGGGAAAAGDPRTLNFRVFAPRT